LSDIVRIETEALEKLPKRFTGLRPDQKTELLRREREEQEQARSQAEERAEIGPLGREYLRREGE
jgi:hypothetical protein